MSSIEENRNIESQQMEKEIKKLKKLLVFFLIIVFILTLLLIGEYVMIWGGAFIEDPNNPGLPLIRIMDLYVTRWYV